jgi:hypothetical protein
VSRPIHSIWCVRIAQTISIGFTSGEFAGRDGSDIY